MFVVFVLWVVCFDSVLLVGGLGGCITVGISVA